MFRISRRRFLAGAAAAGATAFAGRFALASEDKPKITSGTDLVTLGKSGIQTSLLGMGTGTHGGREQLALGQTAFTKLIRHGLDRGVRYIDTADAYNTHLFIRLALEGVSRDKYFIQTKTRATHPEVAKADIERFRRVLKCGHIDSLLMHCMSRESWPTDMRPVMDVLAEAKEKGRVRAIGISSHGLKPLAAAVDCDWADVHLVRINPFGANMDGPPEDVVPQIKKIHKRGRGVLGMKIFGETGFDSRQKRLESLKFVLGLGAVHAFPIGFTSTEQIDETLQLIEKALAGEKKATQLSVA